MRINSFDGGASSIPSSLQQSTAPPPAVLQPYSPSTPMDTLAMSGGIYTPPALLSADDQKVYDQLCRLVSPVHQWALYDMLTLGKLQQKDMSKSPKTLLENLQALATMPVAKGLDNQALLESAITAAHDPTMIVQGSRRATCESAIIEYMLATKNPSELVRLLSGLASPEGTVITASGKKLACEPGSIAPDRSQRSEIDRLLQSAIQRDGRGPLGYTNHDEDGKIKTLLTSGMLPDQFRQAAEHVLNETFSIQGKLVNYLPFDAAHYLNGPLLAQIEQATQKGSKVPVMIDFRGENTRSPSYHYLTVEKIENGRVYFRNPWGSYGVPGTEIEGAGVTRRAEANGLDSISISSFKSRLVNAQIPTEDPDLQIRLPGLLSLLNGPIRVALEPLNVLKRGLKRQSADLVSKSKVEHSNSGGY